MRAIAGHDVACHDADVFAGLLRVGVADFACLHQRLDHLLLEPMGGVHDEHVRLRFESASDLGWDVAVDADGDASTEAAFGVEGGGVDRRPQGAVGGHHAHEGPVGVQNHCELLVGRLEGVEDVLRALARVEGEEIMTHDVLGLREAISVRSLFRCDDTDDSAVVDDDRHVVGPLRDEVQRLADRRGGGDRHWRVEDWVGRLHLPDGLRHDLDGDVLREDR